MKIYDILWKEILSKIDNEVTMLVYDTYFKMITPVDIKDETNYTFTYGDDKNG